MILYEFNNQINSTLKHDLKKAVLNALASNSTLTETIFDEIINDECSTSKRGVLNASLFQSNSEIIDWLISFGESKFQDSEGNEKHGASHFLETFLPFPTELLTTEDHERAKDFVEFINEWIELPYTYIKEVIVLQYRMLVDQKEENVLSSSDIAVNYYSLFKQSDQTEEKKSRAIKDITAKFEKFAASYSKPKIADISKQDIVTELIPMKNKPWDRTRSIKSNILISKKIDESMSTYTDIYNAARFVTSELAFLPLSIKNSFNYIESKDTPTNQKKTINKPYLGTLLPYYLFCFDCFQNGTNIYDKIESHLLSRHPSSTSSNNASRKWNFLNERYNKAIKCIVRILNNTDINVSNSNLFLVEQILRSDFLFNRFGIIYEQITSKIDPIIFTPELEININNQHIIHQSLYYLDLLKLLMIFNIKPSSIRIKMLPDAKVSQIPFVKARDSYIKEQSYHRFIYDYLSDIKNNIELFTGPAVSNFMDNIIDKENFNSDDFISIFIEDIAKTSYADTYVDNELELIDVIPPISDKKNKRSYDQEKAKEELIISYLLHYSANVGILNTL